MGRGARGEAYQIAECNRAVVKLVRLVTPYKYVDAAVGLEHPVTFSAGQGSNGAVQGRDAAVAEAVALELLVSNGATDFLIFLAGLELGYGLFLQGRGVESRSEIIL